MCRRRLGSGVTHRNVARASWHVARGLVARGSWGGGARTRTTVDTTTHDHEAPPRASFVRRARGSTTAKDSCKYRCCKPCRHDLYPPTAPPDIGRVDSIPLQHMHFQTHIETRPVTTLHSEHPPW
eukprot:10913-Prymnesium_polylepis.2